ncbi:phytanoyl-CoA dioxygenase family protein [Vibrio diazotrophicus]|uniref:phytanoyl-CoA dioxygenase family protein n=1 Tax=Vibrio diazotrophicus TaxID=685 RepID=UPI00142E80BF|nr:phytanoyl-CoA dioxygenase family protein [Vibrio diazotrophicus]NIY94212.1 phytanoyl-CoA dioxygenase [Vibrio diazotrophicus]
MNISRYGITKVENDLNINEEEIKRLGYTVIDSGINVQDLKSMRDELIDLHGEYIEFYGAEFIHSIGEHNGIRMPLSMSETFLKLAFNDVLISFVDKVLDNNYILNQQNAVINPASQDYNQAAWHRDLPYQHVVFSRPIAINALFCLDDFTSQNGSTIVIPGSHQFENFPSDEFVNRHALKVEAKAGSFIVLDCMTYHRGSFNSTQNSRCAINHVFTAPIIQQQINMKSNILNKYKLSKKQERILSFHSRNSETIERYLHSRR